ncbi:MAG: hypothetical protein QW200_07980 [Ignisphaera sp.]
MFLACGIGTVAGVKGSRGTVQAGALLLLIPLISTFLLPIADIATLVRPWILCLSTGLALIIVSIYYADRLVTGRDLIANIG